jgi:glycosidase
MQPLQPERPVFGTGAGQVDTPAWVADTVFYQIFPDRFAKSDALEKPSGIEPWDTDPTTYGYKGGDLLGVAEHLDYLVDLGITGLYLNPIFQSASNHRYHTHDYLKVDPLLGGDEAFDALLAACKERGLRIVLDGVFNHASRGFFYFNDVLENGQGSPWRDWFIIGDEFPINAYDHDEPPGYEAWVGLHALPKLNTDNPQMREYLMRVGEYWMRKGIDGWRLDVPDEITTPGFWEEFRQRMRAINPEAYIVGEIWHVSTEYLSGERFDALMNYVFTEAALAFTGRERIVKKLQDDRGYNPWPAIDGNEYADKIDALLGVYDWNVQQAQMNLLDSHDTSRAITLAGDDVRTLELATLLLFTYPGAPTVYYGDEIGLDGGLPDKWARKTFPWDDETRWNTQLREHYQGLIKLRNELPALRQGSYQGIASTPQSYAFERRLGAVSAVVAVNTSDLPDRLVLGQSGKLDLQVAVGDMAEVEATEDGMAISLPARSGGIWVVTHG